MKKLFTILFLCVYFQLIAQIPAGYYTTAEGKTDAALKTQLSAIISAGAIDKGYDGLYAIYQTSDNLPSGKVWDMYSIKADGTAAYYFTHTADKCGNYSAEGNCYNREHTFCDSWLGEASPQRSDAHHILPTDGWVNNKRSSYPHGKVGTVTWTSTNGSKLGTADPSTGYSGVVFEPIDEFKGDFARMYFYVATRYESQIGGWVSNGSAGEILAGNSYPAFKTWFYNLMVQWNAQDPVSPKEITRNAEIFAAQKNRNPYIDYPELVNYIWGSKKGQPWSSTGVVTPVIITPAANSTVAFGKIAYQQTASTSVLINAANLTGDLTLGVTSSTPNSYSLSTTTITKAQAEAGYNLTINFSAQAVGVQTGTLTISGGGISATIINLTANSTSEFLAMPATNISSTSFNANWSYSVNATDYLLNVFSMQSSGGTQAQTLLEEDFTSGLPSTWTSAGYITGTEQAGFIRMGSGGNYGQINTPVLNLSTPTKLTVKAKQYGSDAAGKLIVKVNSDSITSFLTTATVQEYTCDIPQKTSASNISLSVLLGSGKRVYVDYVKVATQGAVATPVSVGGYPKLVGNVLTATVESLTPNTIYYYTVTPQGNSVAVSNQIQLTTLINDDVKTVQNNNLIWLTTTDGLWLRNLPENCTLSVFNTLGRIIDMQKPSANETKLKLDARGIYILQVQKNQEVITYKMIYK